MSTKKIDPRCLLPGIEKHVYGGKKVDPWTDYQRQLKEKKCKAKKKL